jgi:hypothetical protein
MSLEGIIVGLLAMGIGAVWATYGLKAFVILLPIWAFFAGLIGGAAFLQGLFGDDFAFLATTTSWVGGVIIGIVLAVLSYFIYYAAVIILGATVGYALVTGLLGAIGLDGFLATLVGLAGGAAFAIGVIVLAVPAYLVIILTAFSGAAGVVNGALILLGLIKLPDIDQGLMEGLLKYGVVAIVAWIAVAAAGIWYQMRDIRGDMSRMRISAESYRM